LHLLFPYIAKTHKNKKWNFLERYSLEDIELFVQCRESQEGKQLEWLLKVLNSIDEKFLKCHDKSCCTKQLAL
jgi:hypothetical protein